MFFSEFVMILTSPRCCQRWWSLCCHRLIADDVRVSVVTLHVAIEVAAAAVAAFADVAGDVDSLLEAGNDCWSVVVVVDDRVVCWFVVAVVDSSVLIGTRSGHSVMETFEQRQLEEDVGCCSGVLWSLRVLRPLRLQILLDRVGRQT